MDLRKDVNEFLTTRRARITPEAAGLPIYSDSRRVPGLRREEVAMLAGVSVDYYTRIERGQLKGVSESVISGLARVLNLDEAERKYLNNLVAQANEGIRPVAKPRATSVRPSVLRLLETIQDVPAYVRNSRLEIVAANAMAKRFFSQTFDSQGARPNIAKFVYLDSRAQDFYVDWEKIATDTVGVLRAQASKDPYDRQLTDLIGELCTRSEFFAKRWAAHAVFEHKMGTKRFNHPEVGQVELFYEGFDMPQDPGLGMVTYFAAAGTTADNALKFLRIAEYESRTQADAAIEK